MCSDIPKELKHKTTEELLEMKLINENALRNYMIKMQYKTLRDSGKSYNEAIEILAESYFRGKSTIEKIISQS